MTQKHKYIGLDVHKDQNQVAIADDGPTGEVRMYGSISNDLHALEKLTRTLGGENVVLHFWDALAENRLLHCRRHPTKNIGGVTPTVSPIASSMKWPNWSGR